LHNRHQNYLVYSWNAARMPKSLKSAMIDYGSTLRNMIELQLAYLGLAVCDMHATKDIHTEYENKGILDQRREFAEDTSKQSNCLKLAIHTLSTWLSFFDRRSGRGALENVSRQLSKVKPDSRVDETVSTIALLDAMRLIWLSGHVLPRDDLKSASAKSHAAQKRINGLHALNGPIDMTSTPERYQHLGSLLR
jgi:hypothetical protein